MTFDNAIDELPLCLAGDYDPHQHKTPEDLRFLAQTVYDLWKQNERQLSESDVISLRNFLCLFERVA
jgi:hypothetical protein